MNDIRLRIIIDGKELAIDNVRGVEDAVKKVKTSLSGISGEQGKVSGSSNTMRMAVNQLGFALGDASMFAVDFRMGLMGIGNNIPFIIQLMQQVKAETAGTSMSMKDLTMNTLKGGGGLILGVNLLMTTMMFLPKLFDDTTDSMKEQKAAAKALRSELDQLTLSELKNRLVKEQKELKDLFDVGFFEAATANLTGAFGTKGRFERAAELKNEISAIKEQIFLYGKIDELDKRISTNTQKQKDLNRENFSELVNGSKNYEEALATVNQWIKADNDELKKMKEAGTKEEVIIGTLGAKAKRLKDEIDSLQKQKNSLDENVSKGEIERINKQIQAKEKELDFIEGKGKNQLEQHLGLIGKINDALKKLDEQYNSTNDPQQLVAIKKQIIELTNKKHLIEIDVAIKYLQGEGYNTDLSKMGVKFPTQTGEEFAQSQKSGLPKQLGFTGDIIYQEKIVADARIKFEHAVTENARFEAEQQLMIEESKLDKMRNAYNDFQQSQLDTANQVSSIFIAGTDETMNQFLMIHREAKNALDAIWISMYNTFVRVLQDMLAAWIAEQAAEVAISQATGEAKGGSVSSGGSDNGGFGSWIGNVIGGIGRILGFARGGRNKKGQIGILEGYEEELVAPEKTFIEIIRSEIIPTLAARNPMQFIPNRNLSAAISQSNSSSSNNEMRDFIKEVRNWQREMKFHITNRGLVAAVDKGKYDQAVLEGR